MIPLIKRFARKVGPVEPNGCILWMGTPEKKGYARINVHGTYKEMVHRVAYELYVGPIPVGQIVLHTCDNKLCVNAWHLKLGTNKENSEDMVAKGRSAVGESQGLSKLTESDVIGIRQMALAGASQRKIAEHFGVRQKTIFDVIHRVTWKHIS